MRKHKSIQFFEDRIAVTDGTLILTTEEPGSLTTLLGSNSTLITIDTADMGSSYVRTTFELHTLHRFSWAAHDARAYEATRTFTS